MPTLSLDGDNQPGAETEKGRCYITSKPPKLGAKMVFHFLATLCMFRKEAKGRRIPKRGGCPQTRRPTPLAQDRQLHTGKTMRNYPTMMSG